MMSSSECEKYEAEEMQRRILTRERDWHHKQQLDKLPTFTEKIDYWRQEVFKEKNTASAAWLYHATPDFNIEFRLQLEPLTAEDRQNLFDFWIECDRKHLAEERYSVEKFVYDAQKDGQNKIAFYVELLDDRKADLRSRLTTATRKHDLIRAELKATTDALDSAIRNVNGFNGHYFDEIQHMRQCLLLNKPFNFDIEGRKFCSTGAIRIAIVWDIVHYEHFLQNEVASLGAKRDSDILKLYSPEPTASKGRSIPTAGKAINILNSQIERIARGARGNPRRPFKNLVREAINAYAEQMQQQGLKGCSEKSLGRYIEDMRPSKTPNKTPKKYIEEKFRDMLSDKNKHIST